MDEHSRNMLSAAEAIFTEFHHASTSNTRKRELETHLKTAFSAPEYWKFWTDSIAESHNQYLIMHCLNLLNDFISNFWISWATSDQKTYIRSHLLQYLIEKHSVFPSFVVTKIMKLLVDIGRNDWPHLQANFFSDLEGIVANPSLTLVGLKMLRLVSEEFMNPKEDIRKVRKDELKVLMIGKIPAFFGMLEKVLVDGAGFFRSGTPEGGGNSELSKLSRDCVEALQVLNHLLTWLPPGILIPPALLQSVFYFATLDPDNVEMYEIPSSSLNCIAEIAGKRCSSSEMEKNLWAVYEFAFVRLEHINVQLQGQTELSDGATEYFQQFIELLRPLLVNHLQRFESHQGFPTMKFLERFFTFTFQIPAFDLFLSCTDIWNDFLDRLLAVSSCRASTTKSVILQSYSAPILALVDHLLMRIQVQFNRSQLEELSEDIKSGGEGVSEKDDYFQRCIGVMIKAGEILPKQVLEKFVVRYSELQTAFVGIQGLFKSGMNGTQAVITIAVEKPSEMTQLHSILRDLGIVARATASHCGLLTGDVYAAYSGSVLSVVQVVLQGLHFLTDPLACLRNFLAPSPIPEDFAHLHTCLYMSLEALFPWLTQFYSSNAHGSVDGMRSVVGAVVKTCLEPVFQGASPSVMVAGSKTLMSLTRMIRVAGTDELDPIKKLYHLICGGVGDLEERVAGQLLCAMSAVLTLPYNGSQSAEQQGWEERATRHGKMLEAVTERYRRLPLAPDTSPQTLEIIRTTLHLLNSLLLTTTDDPKKCKQILLTSITPLLHKTVHLLPIFQQIPEERATILRFILTVFSSLKSAFPTELHTPLSDLFEGLFEHFLDPDELLRTFHSTDPFQIESLNTCFDLVKLVVADPSYKAYIPVVISLCHIVCPVLKRDRSIRMEFCVASYELLLSVLNYHWTYFFKSSRLIESTNGDGIAVVKDEKTEANDFLVILDCLGAALVHGEISITQMVLKGLNQLHVTRQIYDKIPFKEVLIGDFLRVLLEMLINKEQELVVDEVYLAVYYMGSLDRGIWFHQVCLMGFLERKEGLDVYQKRKIFDGFRLELTQVAFTEQVQTLVAEIRCCVMYNLVKM